MKRFQKEAFTPQEVVDALASLHEKITDEGIIFSGPGEYGVLFQYQPAQSKLTGFLFQSKAEVDVVNRHLREIKAELKEPSQGHPRKSPDEK